MINYTSLTFFLAFLVQSYGFAIGTMQPDVERKISHLAKQRAIFQEQKLRLETDLARNNIELQEIKKTLSGDHRDIFSSLKFLRFVQEHSNQVVFYGSQSSSALERKQRLLEDLTAAQIKTVGDKVKSMAAVEEKQRIAKSRLEQIAAKEDAMAKVEKQITDLYVEQNNFLHLKGTLPTLRGKLDWPVAFKAKERRFGVNLVESSNLIFRNNGIYLATSGSEVVKTVYAGKVIFTGPTDGFGPTVIVDHGDHFYSVYSGLKDISVKVGDWVEGRQKIARSSVVPNLDMSGVYFELRHYTDALDPEPWMKGIVQ